MVTEFQSLAKRIPDCIDGFFSRSPNRIQRNSNVPIKNQLFTLRAYITVVGADMPARDNLMGLGGYSSIRYCNYCYAQGFWNGHIYCSQTPPADAKKNHPSYNFYKLPLWEYNLSQKQAAYIQKTGDKLAIHQTGFRNYTILWKLSSLIFPWCVKIFSKFNLKKVVR